MANYFEPVCQDQKAATDVQDRCHNDYELVPHHSEYHKQPNRWQSPVYRAFNIRQVLEGLRECPHRAVVKPACPLSALSNT